MTRTVSARESLWLATAPVSSYPQLDGDVEVDVAVVGGGVAGLTTALLLVQEGMRVAVVEAERVGAGVTGCTTAKVSALQGTVYSKLRKHSTAAAETYAAASVVGVEGLASLVSEHAIDCALERRRAVTYAATPEQRRAVEAEADAAAAAGLDAELVEDAGLPFETHGAVVVTDQAQIQPVRYCQGLAEAIVAGGSLVFEGTRAVEVSESSRPSVHTTSGTVHADHVVIASHFPFLDRGLYFARLEPQRSYCIAAQLASGAPPDDMAISAGTPTRSVRSFGDVLVVGGEGHAVGSSEATTQRFGALEQFARAHWDVAGVTHRWSAQDPTSDDSLPLIGPYRVGSSRLWVATGFMKWGFATATFAAGILRDLIAGHDNHWAGTFTPLRLAPRSVPFIARRGAGFVSHQVVDRVTPASRDVDQLAPGEGRAVSSGLGKKGVYRDENGTLHSVSLRCTHQGCLLHFNAAEKSWDCPCHGSRFDVDGAVLEGPATAPLPPA